MPPMIAPISSSTMSQCPPSISSSRASRPAQPLLTTMVVAYSAVLAIGIDAVAGTSGRPRITPALSLSVTGAPGVTLALEVDPVSIDLAILPDGGHFCMYALQAVLPLLPAKQRKLPAGDWLERDDLVACPDPEERLIMRVVRTGIRSMPTDELT